MKFYGNTVEEIINNIFMEVLTVKTFKKPRGGEDLYGFYAELPSRNGKDVMDLELIQRLFYNCKSLANQKVMGLNNACDSENTFAQMLEYMFIILNDYFNGKYNEQVNLEELQVYDVDDIYRIFNDEELLDCFCKFVYGVMNNKFRDYVKTGNPDFYYNTTNQEFQSINYLYLDAQVDEEYSNLHDIISKEEFEKHTGNLTTYIFSNYWNNMTKAQQQWCNAVIDFGIQSDGSVWNLDTNELLYSPQQCYQFKKQIKKRLEKLIKDDVHINENNNRWTLK